MPQLMYLDQERISCAKRMLPDVLASNIVLMAGRYSLIDTQIAYDLATTAV